MDMTLSQLEEITKEEKPTFKRGKINVERKIDAAMKLQGSQQKDTSLQSYTDNKIKNIYKFLDTVDDSQTHDKNKNKNDIVDNLEKEHQYQTKIQQLNGQTKTQQIELDDTRRTIDNLKQILDKAQVRIKEQDVIYKEQLNNRLNEQKIELETVINRHLGFIDQLLADKKDLNNSNEVLTNDLKGIEEHQQKQLDQQKLQFQREIKQNKDAWVASEKQRRDRWQQEKVSEIKEQTIRGLEPEIERMVEKSKKDTKRLEEKQQREMDLFKAQVVEDLELRYKAQKEKILSENDLQIKKERDAISSRTKDSYEKFHKELEVERERIKQRYDLDLVDVERRRKEEADGYVKRLRLIQDEHGDEQRRTKQDCKSQIDEMRGQQVNLEKLVKDQLKIEQQQWMDQSLQKMQKDMQKKLQQEQMRMEKERNEQIEVILQRLSQEQATLEKDISSKYDKKYREQCTSYETDIKALKREISAAADKQTIQGGSAQSTQDNLEILAKQYLELQQQQNNLNDELKKAKYNLAVSQQALISTIEENSQKIKGMHDVWEKERNSLSSQVNQMNGSMQEQKMMYDQIIQKQEYKNAEELEVLDGRVKKILNSKSLEIKTLQEELKMKELACRKYEEMLKRQREDLLHHIEK